MLGAWVSLWKLPSRDLEPHPLSWDVSDAAPLPKLEPAAARAALGSFRPNPGLGWDSIRPRWIEKLPEALIA
eukprot:1032214-Pyramimonas_sp.AAC.1